MNNATDFHHELLSENNGNQSPNSIFMKDLKQYIGEIFAAKGYYNGLNTNIDHFLFQISFDKYRNYFVKTDFNEAKGLLRYHLDKVFLDDLNLYITYLDFKQTLHELIEMRELHSTQVLQYSYFIQGVPYQKFREAFINKKMNELFKDNVFLEDIFYNIIRTRDFYVIPSILIKRKGSAEITAELTEATKNNVLQFIDKKV